MHESQDARGASSTPRSDRVEALDRLLGIVDRLRDPGGCPWDREQTVESMAAFVIEEGHELVEAIERGDDRGAVEEAGDLLMVLAMIARIASESRRFDLAEAAQAVSDKLVRRHPHVFGEVEVAGSGEVLANWERIKQEERRGKREDASALAGIPRSLPALQRADRTCAKAIAAGFRWTSAEGAFRKLGEELGELLRELGGVDLEKEGKVELEEGVRGRVEGELGDLLLATAFVGTYLGIDPERACRGAVRRFEERFRQMESTVSKGLREHSLEELLAAWREAKRALE